MTSQPQQYKRGIVKQVLSGDSVIIRALTGAPPPERQLSFSCITAPKLARRGNDLSEETKDEPYAWEAREFLRKKLVGEEVWFTAEKPPNAMREYGCVLLGKDLNTAENMTESLVSEGLVGVREGVRQTPEIVRLGELEDAAKSAGKGKWVGNNAEHVRDIKWTVENSRTFVDKQGGKPVKAIIEHVRDGSTVRAFLLPDFYHITLMISGIRCPGFKLDEKGRPDPTTKVPYAEEARYFVEVRLLQREVDIVLESVNNNNFVGSILHPRGNIAELLLKEGFAKCVDWSIAFMKTGADRLRAAERKAKEDRLRLWKDWQSSAPQITGKEKEFTGTVVEVINGDALCVKLGNGQVKKLFLSSIRPPKEASAAKPTEEDGGKPVMQPRPKGFRPLYDIPWMFEAREFLRKKLIGKKVNVVVDYIQPSRESLPEKICSTVTIGGINVAEALVSKGLATVVRYRQDDDQRSSHYDELMSAETKAAKSQKGVHSKKDIPVHRVRDISDAVKAKQFLPSVKRAQSIEAIVEFVASGSRLRLYIPNQHCLATFLLGGISCPRAARASINGSPAIDGEEYGDESLLYTKEKCLQHEVSIQIDSLDKAGNFIGWLWIDNNNLSVSLVEEGFASVHPTAERTEYFRQLKTAEDSAKQRRLRRWKNWVDEVEEQIKVEEDNKVVERTIQYEEIIVTEVTPEGTFFAQKIDQGPKLEALNDQFRQQFAANPPLPGAYTPKRGQICASKFTEDEQWYRAKIEKVQGTNVQVLYIDYGNRETLNMTRLANLPTLFASDKAFSTEYSLACIQVPSDPDYARDTLKFLKEDMLTVPKLLMNVEYHMQGALPAATVVTPDKVDIAKTLISEGLLMVEKRRERRLQKLVTEYTAAQDAARANHLAIWEYGDITEDTAKEFGLTR